MEKKLKKKKVDDLLKPLYELDLEKVYYSLKKGNKRNRKEILTILSVFLSSILIVSATLIFNNPKFLVGLAVSFGGLGFYSIVRDITRDIRQMKSVRNNINSNIPANTSSTTLQKTKTTNLNKVEREHYTRKYGKLITEANKNNKGKLIKPKMEVYIKDTEGLEVNEIIEEMKKEINVYYAMYELPPFIINDDELFIIVNHIKDIYIKNRKSGFYDYFMNIIKQVFAKSFVVEYEAIGVEEILENVDYMKYTGFKENAINNLKIEIMDSIRNSRRNNLQLSKKRNKENN